MTVRDQSLAAVAPLYPYQYEMLWRLDRSPLTAAALGAIGWNGGQWTAQETANRLRSLTHRNLVYRATDGRYFLTADGNEWMHGEAE